MIVTKLMMVNATRGVALGCRIRLADSWWSRLRGFLGRPEPIIGDGILLSPCSRIHTFGMSFPLDVLFLDRKGRVLEAYPDVRPWRMTPRVRDSSYALELPVGTIRHSGTQVGDRLTWRVPSKSQSARWDERIESRTNEEGRSNGRTDREDISRTGVSRS